MSLSDLPIIIKRSPLRHANAAIAKGRITVGFIGGSITDPRPRFNWPESVLGWMADRWPGLRIRVENAAIGGTNSELACFRARRDLIERGCDIVFVDYVVNDLTVEPARRVRSREGLLRQILATGRMDAVLVHLFAQGMWPAWLRGDLHPSTTEFETLAEHYGLSSIFSGLHAYRQVCSGILRSEDWLPDGTHPQARGSLSYAEPVVRFLDESLAADAVESAAPKALPAPLDAARWEHIRFTKFEDIALKGPWFERRWAHHTGFDIALETTSPEASFSAEVHGHTIALGWDEGLDASRFSWRIDGGEWQTYERAEGAWLPESALYRSVVLTENLTDGPHRVEVRNSLWPHPGKLTGRLSVAFLAGVQG